MASGDHWAAFNRWHFLADPAAKLDEQLASKRERKDTNQRNRSEASPHRLLRVTSGARDQCYSTVHSYGTPMRFAVRFLRRRGRILPRRDVVNQAPLVGDLRIEECLDAELRRYVRTARLFDVASPIYSNKLPELLDVRLMAMSPQAFTLAGLERSDGVEYAQSWLVNT